MNDKRGIGFFERYLSGWVALCICGSVDIADYIDIFYRLRMGQGLETPS